MKERIDILLVERRLVESRTKAQWLIRNGLVLVNGMAITKPGKKIDNSLSIDLKAEFPYVGRGGIKLEKALEIFSIPVYNKVCADIGASIGGFTDCLLKHGASKIYAVDKAIDLLHPSLICEKMKDLVIPILGIDAREHIPIEEKVDICTVDVTFSSLKKILPNINSIVKKEGDIIALIKPVFEIDFVNEARFDIIQNTMELREILQKLCKWCINNKFYIYGLIKSPLLGKGGSIEFLLHLRIDEVNPHINYKEIISKII